MSFNQGIPGIPTLINSSAVLVTGNAVSANALTVRQFGTGNVFSAQTTTGATALFVGANGNVGIGTASPASPLQIHCGDNWSAGITLSSAATGSSVANQYMIQRGAASISVGGSSWNASNVMVFHTTNETTATTGPVGFLWASSGSRIGMLYDTRNSRLGIGTTNPTYLLDVELNQDTNQGAHVINASTGANAGATWGIGNANGDNRGGIGLWGSAFTSSSIYRRDGVYTWCTGVGGYTINSAAANSNVYIAVANTERMRITSAGYVGIGATSPGCLLDFNRSGNYNQIISLAYGTGAAPATATDFVGFGVIGTISLRYQSASATNGGHYWYMGATEAMSLINVAGNSSLGIGKTPGYQLDLSTDGARKLTTTTWLTGSDERIKTDIQSANLQTCYDTIKSIDLKYFKWNFPAESNVAVDDKHSLGFIAQDVKNVFPNAVFESNSYGFTDFLTLNTDQILKAMYGALRQTMADKESLEKRLAALESKLAA